VALDKESIEDYLPDELYELAEISKVDKEPAPRHVYLVARAFSDTPSAAART
jgi:hypothetical protein